MSDKREYLCFGPGDLLGIVGKMNALDPNKKWRITIQPYRKNRTTDQNRLMWRWNEIIAEHTGHAPAEVHKWCKTMFLAPRYITIADKQVAEWTTTKLSTAEMSEYLERIRAWAATDLNITLSDWGEER